MGNKTSEDVKDISNKVKALAESKKAMKVKLSRLQKDLENMMCGFFFWTIPRPKVGTRILGLVLVVWWTGLGSPQLYWADYEPSCSQNMDPTKGVQKTRQPAKPDLTQPNPSGWVGF